MSESSPRLRSKRKSLFGVKEFLENSKRETNENVPDEGSKDEIRENVHKTDISDKALRFASKSPVQNKTRDTDNRSEINKTEKSVVNIDNRPDPENVERTAGNDIPGETSKHLDQANISTTNCVTERRKGGSFEHVTTLSKAESAYRRLTDNFTETAPEYSLIKDSESTSIESPDTSEWETPDSELSQKCGETFTSSQSSVEDLDCENDYIPPRKKLRSEVRTDELWDGIPMTVVFKRLAPINKKTRPVLQTIEDNSVKQVNENQLTDIELLTVGEHEHLTGSEYEEIVSKSFSDTLENIFDLSKSFDHDNSKKASNTPGNRDPERLDLDEGKKLQTHNENTPLRRSRRISEIERKSAKKSHTINDTKQVEGDRFNDSDIIVAENIELGNEDDESTDEATENETDAEEIDSESAKNSKNVKSCLGETGIARTVLNMFTKSKTKSKVIPPLRIKLKEPLKCTLKKGNTLKVHNFGNEAKALTSGSAAKCKLKIKVKVPKQTEQKKPKSKKKQSEINKLSTAKKKSAGKIPNQTKKTPKSISKNSEKKKQRKW